MLLRNIRLLSRTTQHNIPKDPNINNHCCENLNSHNYNNGLGHATAFPATASEAFRAAKVDEIFSSYQPCELVNNKNISKSISFPIIRD